MTNRDIQTAIDVFLLLIALCLVLSPVFLFAKDEQAAARKAERKVEFEGKNLVEKVKVKKGTNDVWEVRRTFPLMFSRYGKNVTKK